MTNYTILDKNEKPLERLYQWDSDIVLWIKMSR